MANPRIENRVDARIDLTRGQETARNGRGLPAQGEGQGAGFASLLASLDGLSPLPVATALQSLGGGLGGGLSSGLSGGLGGLAGAAAAATALAQDATAGTQADAALLQADPAALPQAGDASSALAAGQLISQAQDLASPLASGNALAQVPGAQRLLSRDGKPLPSEDTTQTLAADALLLAASGQMPWTSLVGQTAQLDGKADRDLVQGAAGDWLSGRGNAAMALLRQEQGQAVGAHAAFMSPQQAGDGAALAASAAAAGAAAADAAAADTVGQADGLAGAPGRQASLAALAAATDPLAAAVADAPGAGASRSALPSGAAQQPADLSGAGVRQDTALASGIALQGMAAVRPEEWRGLFERARDARTGAVSGSDASDSAGSALHGVAAAVGAAQAGQQAGQQPAGQDASASAQAQPDARAGASEREQEISEKVAFWVHSKSQNASLTVDHEGRAIQVQVSLQGNEAHVRFGSSEAQAREWLGNGADQLRELLQAQGLQLGGVSVDAGAQQGTEGRDGRQGPGGQARQGRVSAMVDAAGVAEGRSPSRAGGRAAGGVDLFV